MDIREKNLLGGGENFVEMQDLEEEDFALSKSSAADAEFDAVIGNIEDIIMGVVAVSLELGLAERFGAGPFLFQHDCAPVLKAKPMKRCMAEYEDDFQQLQQNFMEKYYQEFDDTEENKLIYTPIFNEYIELLEKHLEQQLVERMPGFSMSAFTQSLKHHKDEVSGDIFDMLLTFTDFMAFKEMFIDYRAEREGRGLDLSEGLVVRSLACVGPSLLPSATAVLPQ